MLNRVATIKPRPTFSLLMRVNGEPQSVVERSVESVLAQIYSDWQLIIVDCGSMKPYMAATLASLSLTLALQFSGSAARRDEAQLSVRD